MRLLLCCTCCLLLAGEELDTIVLSNGQRLSGQVEQTEDDGTVVVRTAGGGRVRLSPEQVAVVRPSLERRLTGLDGRNREECLEVVRLCLVAERRADALRALRRADELASLAPAQLRLLARLVDEVEGPEPALPVYQRWASSGDTDASTQARLRVLQQAIADYERAKSAVLAEAAKLPPVRDGLEVDPTWKSEDPRWANGATLTAISGENNARPNHVLQVDLRAGDKYKAAIVLAKVLAPGDSTRFTFWVHNTDFADLALSMAVKTGPTNEYFESLPFRVKASARWQEVTFDLSAQDYKSAASNWSYTAAIAHLQQIRELQVQVHNQQQSGRVLIDGIGFAGGNSQL